MKTLAVDSNPSQLSSDLRAGYAAVTDYFGLFSLATLFAETRCGSLVLFPFRLQRAILSKEASVG